MPIEIRDWDRIPEETLNRTYEYSWATQADSRVFTNKALPLRDILKDLTTYERGAKTGRCILQGKLFGKGGERKKAAMERNHFLIFDIDDGTPLDEVIDIVEGTDCLAVVYTTHSHMSCQSDVPERRYYQWARKFLRNESDPTVDSLRQYFMTVKRYRPEVLEGMSFASEFTKDGKKFVVTHKSMSKCRIVFPLVEPFDFTVGRHEPRMVEWSKRYAAVAKFIGVSHDTSCEDPGRLFYTPRIALDANLDDHTMILFGSDICLDIFHEAFDIGPSKEDEIAAAFGGNGSKKEYKTKNLLKFAALAGHDFEAGEFLIDQYGDEHIRREVSEGKYEFRCPNEDAHTSIREDDTAFMVVNASASDDTGFHMGCLHDTCKNTFDDRLDYLDYVCQEKGIEDALSLISPEYTPEVYGESNGTSDTVAPAVALPRGLTMGDVSKYIAANVTPETFTPDVQTHVCEMIASLDLPKGSADECVLCDQLKSASGKHSLTVIKAEVTRIKREAKKAHTATVKAIEKAKKVEEVERKIKESGRPAINVAQHQMDVFNQVLDAVKSVQAEDASIFYTNDGEASLVRVVDGKDILIKPMSKDDWETVVGGTCEFFKKTKDDASLQTVPPPVIKMFHSQVHRHHWPRLVRVVKVPVFTEDGHIMSVTGYDVPSQTYFFPVHDYLPVSSGVTDEDVEKAKDILYDVFRDQPLTDCFGEKKEELPQYSDELDEEEYNGKRWPKHNPERGVSSRAHLIAACLNQYARSFIAGPTPLFVIDKRVAGSGGSLLCQMIATISSGYPAAETKLPDIKSTSDLNAEAEIEKKITMLIKDAKPVVIFDNVEQRLASATLASALTGRTWGGRVLGKSESINSPITCTWIANGNNVDFEEQIRRRCVPIGIDALMAQPHLRGRDRFKYFEPLDMLEQNHPRYAWACCVLIQRWLDAGRPGPSDHRVLNSFGAWSHVMGGILEVCGIPGFLENVKTFTEDRYEDPDPIGEVWQIVFDELCANAPTGPWKVQFTSTEMFKVIYEDTYGGGGFKVDEFIDLRAHEDEEIAFRKLTQRLKEMRRKPYSIWWNNAKLDCQIIKLGKTRGAHYHFKPVRGG